LLTDAGFMKRSQYSTHAARMYDLQTSGTGWLRSLIDIASTHDGLRSLLDAMKEASEAEASLAESTQSDVLRRTRRRTSVS